MPPKKKIAAKFSEFSEKKVPDKGELINAVRSRDQFLVKELLKRGADPDETDQGGNSASIIAGWSGDYEIMEALRAAREQQIIEKRNKAEKARQDEVRARQEALGRSQADQRLKQLRQKSPKKKALKK